jgi:hypothetical protein
MSNVRTDPTSPLPPPGGTTLVSSDRFQLQLPFSLNRETDLRTALTRGLKEYLEQLSIDWIDGRQERFSKVSETWAESETNITYPSAAVYSEEELEHLGTDDAPMTPTTETDPLTNTQYIKPDEVRLVMTVLVWAQDPVQRMVLCAMLEDAFAPVEWMRGFRLDLPHYHNQRGEYSLVASRYLDNETDDQRRYRKAEFVVEGRVPQIRILGPGVPMRSRASISINGKPARVAGPEPHVKPQE